MVLLHRQAPPRISHVPEMAAVAILRGVNVRQTLLNPGACTLAATRIETLRIGNLSCADFCHTASFPIGSEPKSVQPEHNLRCWTCRDSSVRWGSQA